MKIECVVLLFCVASHPFILNFMWIFSREFLTSFLTLTWYHFFWRDTFPPSHVISVRALSNHKGLAFVITITMTCDIRAEHQAYDRNTGMSRENRQRIIILESDIKQATTPRNQHKWWSEENTICECWNAMRSRGTDDHWPKCCGWLRELHLIVMDKWRRESIVILENRGGAEKMEEFMRGFGMLRSIYDDPSAKI